MPLKLNADLILSCSKFDTAKVERFFLSAKQIRKNFFIEFRFRLCYKWDCKVIDNSQRSQIISKVFSKKNSLKSIYHNI